MEIKRVFVLKGQASVELLTLTVLGALVLIVATIIGYTYTNQFNAQKISSGGRALCSFFSGEVNIAASFGEGYARAFYLPSVATEFSYSIEFDNAERRVSVAWERGSCFRPLLANVTGILKAGRNTLSFENGAVVLN